MREDITAPPQSTGLPFQVRMSGISYCDGSYVIRRPASRLTCMEFVIRGKGTVSENGVSFSAEAGDIYLLHEGRDHYYYSDGEDPWIKIWMNLSGTAVEHLIYAYGLNAVNHVRGLDLEQEFREFYETAGASKTAVECSDRCSVLFHQILQKIAGHLRNQEDSGSATARRIKEIIDAAKGYDVSLEDLAQQMFFTKTHLIRVFRAEYNVTPYEYILARKLRLAKDLLINTSLPIAEISSYLNFCDAHYFTNFFRSRAGMSPREYRKRKGC